VRFFIGILGGSFVPCQVWSTGFFDKRVVGTANALTGGFGNAGGGITYFVMPAIYNSLVRDGLTKHKAWRVSFIVPGILIVSTAILLLVLCPDCPTGEWSKRQSAVDANLREQGTVIAIPSEVNYTASFHNGSNARTNIQEKEKKAANHPAEVHISAGQMTEAAKGEVIQKPTFREATRVIFTLQTLVTCACYFCSFGAELSINSILGSYYHKNFPKLTLQNFGNWAAMFGLLNIVCRPLGGFIGDLAYRKSGSVWGKKILLHVYSILMGIFLIAIGKTNSYKQSSMFGLVAGLAFFLEGANGLNFAYVPHVHPFANGIVSGVTGASGNFGGIIFAIIFRYNGTNYAKSFWIIGTITICLNVAVCWIKPIPKGQIGGH
jgi:NNP family nitrate/nitrite transporter-like MFS transporter